MKCAALIFSLLLVTVVLVPVVAAETGPIGEETTTAPTEEPVTIQPVTSEITAVPTAVPTTEITEEPTVIPTTEQTQGPITEQTTQSPDVGWLSITSTPSAADVMIDGQQEGITPLVGLDVTAGTAHTVQVTLDGYTAYSDSVTVGNGEQAAIDATLNPLPTPVPTTEPTPVPTEEPVGGDKGWISVSANVDGATVSFDNNPASCTILGGSCDTEVTVTGTQYKTFTVQKPGYNIYTAGVTTWPAKGETTYLYATLNPVTQFGSVAVSSYPTGAVAYLDGQTWQYTPCTFSNIPANTNHIVSVSKAGYQSYTSTVYVPAGSTTQVSIDLVPSPSGTGSLSVTTVPSGADIYIDGRYWSPSPAVIPNLAPGGHTVRLQKVGYDEYVHSVTIYASQQTPLSVTFSKSPPNVGSIEIYSSPSGAAIYLDGSYMGTTYTSDGFDLTSITPGLHTVQLKLDDYQTYTQTIKVSAGGIATINAALVPLPPGPSPDTTGQIIITSSPSGADVYLDNSYRGITPVTLPDIAAGQHTLLLKETGYSDYTTVVTVTGSIATPVAATLTSPEPTTTKAPVALVTVLLSILGAGIAVAARKR